MDCFDIRFVDGYFVITLLKVSQNITWYLSLHNFKSFVSTLLKIILLQLYSKFGSWYLVTTLLKVLLQLYLEFDSWYFVTALLKVRFTTPCYNFSQSLVHNTLLLYLEFTSQYFCSSAQSLVHNVLLQLHLKSGNMLLQLQLKSTKFCYNFS